MPDPMQELRDVHLPDAISWWPPAFGWWMMIVVVALVVSGLLWVRAYRKRTRPRRIALAQLQHVKQQYAVQSDDRWAITQVSNLLRRYSLALYSRSQVAGLSGKSWLQFLDTTGGTNQFSEGPGQSLRSSPYQAENPTSVADLFPLVERWIRQVHIPARNPTL